MRHTMTSHARTGAISAFATVCVAVATPSLALQQGSSRFVTPSLQQGSSGIVTRNLQQGSSIKLQQGSSRVSAPALQQGSSLMQTFLQQGSSLMHIFLQQGSSKISTPALQQGSSRASGVAGSSASTKQREACEMHQIGGMFGLQETC